MTASDRSTTATKLVGAPGSGKTSALLDSAADEAAEHGTDIEELLFVTYTRSAAGDARERLGEVYGGATDGELRGAARTFHAAVRAACIEQHTLDIREALRPPHAGGESGHYIATQANDPDVLRWFFENRLPGWHYDPDAGDPLERLERDGERVETPAGNRLLALDNYLRNQRWAPSDHQHAPIAVDRPPGEVRDALREWRSFKADNALLQHDDYIEHAIEAGVFPPASVLLVDELQDLTPLQHVLLRRWRDARGVERVYLAGDQNQSIFGFRGADPALFRETPADETVREETSYRCPQAVVEAAVPVVDAVAEHDANRVAAREDGGTFEHDHAPEPDDLGDLVTRSVERYAPETDEDDDAAVFLLARTNSNTAKLAAGLREAGVPYRDLADDGALNRWRHPASALLAALRLYAAGEALAVETAEALLAHTTTAPARAEAQATVEETDAGLAGRHGHAVAAEQVRAWFPDADTPRDLARRLTVDGWRRELLDGALGSDATNDPDDVRIGTIHAAKGREAPCVLVFPTYSRAQLERYHDGAEAEERRLFYVAMTRAADTCLVVHDYFGGPEFPPLQR